MNRNKFQRGQKIVFNLKSSSQLSLTSKTWQNDDDDDNNIYETREPENCDFKIKPECFSEDALSEKSSEVKLDSNDIQNSDNTLKSDRKIDIDINVDIFDYNVNHSTTKSNKSPNVKKCEQNIQFENTLRIHNKKKTDPDNEVRTKFSDNKKVDKPKKSSKCITKSYTSGSSSLQNGMMVYDDDYLSDVDINIVTSNIEQPLKPLSLNNEPLNKETIVSNESKIEIALNLLKAFKNKNTFNNKIESENTRSKKPISDEKFNQKALELVKNFKKSKSFDEQLDQKYNQSVLDVCIKDNDESKKINGKLINIKYDQKIKIINYDKCSSVLKEIKNEVSKKENKCIEKENCSKNESAILYDNKLKHNDAIKKMIFDFKNQKKDTIANAINTTNELLKEFHKKRKIDYEHSPNDIASSASSSDSSITYSSSSYTSTSSSSNSTPSSIGFDDCSNVQLEKDIPDESDLPDIKPNNYHIQNKILIDETAKKDIIGSRLKINVKDSTGTLITDIIIEEDNISKENKYNDDFIEIKKEIIIRKHSNDDNTKNKQIVLEMLKNFKLKQSDNETNNSFSLHNSSDSSWFSDSETESTSTVSSVKSNNSSMSMEHCEPRCISPGSDGSSVNNIPTMGENCNSYEKGGDENFSPSSQKKKHKNKCELWSEKVAARNRGESCKPTKLYADQRKDNGNETDNAADSAHRADDNPEKNSPDSVNEDATSMNMISGYESIECDSTDDESPIVIDDDTDISLYSPSYSPVTSPVSVSRIPVPAVACVSLSSIPLPGDDLLPPLPSGVPPPLPPTPDAAAVAPVRHPGDIPLPPVEVAADDSDSSEVVAEKNRESVAKSAKTATPETPSLLHGTPVKDLISKYLNSLPIGKLQVNKVVVKSTPKIVFKIGSQFKLNSQPIAISTSVEDEWKTMEKAESVISNMDSSDDDSPPPPPPPKRSINIFEDSSTEECVICSSAEISEDESSTSSTLNESSSSSSSQSSSSSSSPSTPSLMSSDECKALSPFNKSIDLQELNKKLIESVNLYANEEKSIEVKELPEKRIESNDEPTLVKDSEIFTESNKMEDVTKIPMKLILNVKKLKEPLKLFDGIHDNKIQSEITIPLNEETSTYMKVSTSYIGDVSLVPLPSNDAQEESTVPSINIDTNIQNVQLPKGIEPVNAIIDIENLPTLSLITEQLNKEDLYDPLHPTDDQCESNENSNVVISAKTTSLFKPLKLSKVAKLESLPSAFKENLDDDRVNDNSVKKLVKLPDFREENDEIDIAVTTAAEKLLRDIGKVTSSIETRIRLDTAKNPLVEKQLNLSSTIRDDTPDRRRQKRNERSSRSRDRKSISRRFRSRSRERRTCNRQYSGNNSRDHRNNRDHSSSGRVKTSYRQRSKSWERRTRRDRSREKSSRNRSPRDRSPRRSLKDRSVLEKSPRKKLSRERSTRNSSREKSPKSYRNRSPRYRSPRERSPRKSRSRGRRSSNGTSRTKKISRERSTEKTIRKRSPRNRSPEEMLTKMKVNVEKSPRKRSPGTQSSERTTPRVSPRKRSPTTDLIKSPLKECKRPSRRFRSRSKSVEGKKAETTSLRRGDRDNFDAPLDNFDAHFNRLYSSRKVERQLAMLAEQKDAATAAEAADIQRLADEHRLMLQLEQHRQLKHLQQQQQLALQQQQQQQQLQQQQQQYHILSLLSMYPQLANLPRQTLEAMLSQQLQATGTAAAMAMVVPDAPLTQTPTASVNLLPLPLDASSNACESVPTGDSSVYSRFDVACTPSLEAVTDYYEGGGKDRSDVCSPPVTPMPVENREPEVSSSPGGFDAGLDRRVSFSSVDSSSDGDADDVPPLKKHRRHRSRHYTKTHATSKSARGAGKAKRFSSEILTDDDDDSTSEFAIKKVKVQEETSPSTDSESKSADESGAPYYEKIVESEYTFVILI